MGRGRGRVGIGLGLGEVVGSIGGRDRKGVGDRVVGGVRAGQGRAGVGVGVGVGAGVEGVEARVGWGRVG